MKQVVLNLALILSLVIPAIALAQDYNSGIRQELDDLDQMYPKRTKKSAKGAKTTTIEVRKIKTQRVEPAASEATLEAEAQSSDSAANQNNTQVQVQSNPSATSVQPIYILQQPVNSQAQVQPSTTIEAAAVRESRAEQMRKQREEIERQTENKLIERLEDDRVLSEKERADRLFTPRPSPTPAAVVPAAAASSSAAAVVTGDGAAAAASSSAGAANLTPVATPAPAPAAPVIVQSSSSATSSKEPEVTVVGGYYDDLKPVEEAKTKFSVGGLGGIGSYPSVGNVTGAYAAGVVAEMQFADRLGLEGAFVFSSFDIRNDNACIACGQSLIVTLNQMNFTLGLKYHILPGRISPVVGVLAGYTRRSYSDRVSWNTSANSIRGSNAFDGGFMAGVDIQATPSLTVGADIRYLTNISYRTDDPLAYGFGGPTFGSPIEGLSYYFAGLNLKLSL
jgi:outer membrane protein W